ncbi:MAG: AGE family epimerase/isomerase [Spirochaetes bacterium]|nr:AGE family epimerase/isomerase [Spirochaetota bacterium]
MKISGDGNIFSGDGLLLNSLKTWIETVLMENIFDYWFRNIIDEENNCFYGAIDKDENKITEADKGLIFYTRILWAMSRGYGNYRDERMRKIADMAYDYLIEKFHDHEYGGFFWELDFRGNVKNSRKSIYGQAFSVYALSEYAKIFNRRDALDYAVSVFNLIETYAKDEVNNGYIETFSREWRMMDDIRLSEVDLNTEKSNNTHLHLMEAYTVLYEIKRDEITEKALKNSIDVILNRVLDRDSLNFRLFFNREWKVECETISCGHEIEAAWLIERALNVLADEDYSRKNIHLVKEISHNCLSYVWRNPPHSALNNEIDKYGNVDRKKIWWVQAEACVGFFNEYERNAEKEYLTIVSEIWSFIEMYIVDRKNGEWYHSAKEPGADEHPYKLDGWKSCYHNVRACIELIERIEKCSGENK